MTKILVVDDIADNVKLLSYLLTDAGYDVLTAFDRQEVNMDDYLSKPIKKNDLGRW